MKVKEKLRGMVRDEHTWLASLAIIFAIAVSFFQIGFANLLLTIVALILLALLWIIICQWVQLKEQPTAADKLKEHLRDCENPNLKMETIRQTTHITGPNVIIKRFIGMNYSNKDSSYLVVHAGGDKELAFKELHFKAYDAKGNHLEVKPLKFKDRWASKVKILKIEFKDLLKPKETFDITMEYRWPGAIDLKGDSVGFTVSPYKFVDSAEFEVIFNAKSKPKAYTFFTTDTCIEITCASEIEEQSKLKLRYHLKYIGTEDYKFTFGICEDEGVCKNKRSVFGRIQDALMKLFYSFKRFYDNSHIAE